MIEKTGNVSYTVKDTNEVVTVPIAYPAYDTVDEAIEAMSEGKVLAVINQTVKEDVGNNEREKAKVTNGHSTRPVMSDEEKEEARAKRKAEKSAKASLLEEFAEAKGMTVAELLASKGL